LRTIAPNAIVRTVYGSTEAEPIASIDGHQLSFADRLKTREGGGLLVGKPVRGCMVRVVRNCPGQVLGPYTVEAFSNQCLPPGGAGEIVVSGEHVLQGYADSSCDRETKIQVQSTVWHRTGDAGYFDTSGRLWLVGRCAAALQDYRGTVYPFQVEYAVTAVRGVRRAALVEMDGDRVLVLETSGREFRNHCAEAARCVADFEIDRIVTLHRIPVDRRHDAKVDYPALARLLDGRFHRCRNAIVGWVSRVFTYCRDGYVCWQSQAQIGVEPRHRSR
jgi:acyl-CoA synthetase (AMP-forming)/AMP-acid ligase II